MTIKQIQNLIHQGLQNGDFTRQEVQQLSDGVHTFADVYDRAAHWNALALSLMHKVGIETAKSHWHNGCEPCPPGTFIVGAQTSFGQITQHYEKKHWGLFQIPAYVAFPWRFDGHTKKDVQERICKLIGKFDQEAFSFGVGPIETAYTPRQGKIFKANPKDLMDHGYLVEPPKWPICCGNCKHLGDCKAASDFNVSGNIYSPESKP